MILKDRVAIVTAAGSGIGRAGARAMAQEGAYVIVADLDSERCGETAAEITSKGGHAEPCPTNVGDDAALEALIEGTIARHGRIDILHNHAGIQIAGNLEKVAPEGLDASYRINLRAQFMAAKLAVPHMKDQGGGVILNTSSNAGVYVDNNMLAYNTTKYAVIAMTQQMAIDYGPHGIRVNALCPGWVDTLFNAPYQEELGGRDALLDVIATKVPLGRFGTEEEMAEAILFLVSDRSSYVTGHALVVDGGEAIANT
jgi:NAD(P)-dependent dehydrogenase (short-subunit alcohol dehydrogenase family)